MKYTGLRLPVTMGHELSGTVIKVGSAVTSLALGQEVAVNPAVDHRQYGAELCGPCKTGRDNTCNAMSIYGLSAPGGGFCEEIVVNALNCLALPAGVSKARNHYIHSTLDQVE